MGATNANKGLVYIVDDESMLVALADDILANEGFTTKLFLSAEEALEALRARDEDPALLITDCVMREMDGIKLIEESKKLIPPIKTILVSGTIQESFIKSQAVQPDQFLAKPYHVQGLIDAVYKVLG
ncbi:MAG: hybrid sensor histidine kinase/response regulator [Verrucomicrobiales bacterium]|jgi:DNA-binding NtrC family response regulator|nr:hybrid sensor histidine kinase/response regulator [Verrucomicrobiales bacterium]